MNFNIIENADFRSGKYALFVNGKFYATSDRICDLAILAEKIISTYFHTNVAV